ncbi:MFS transporter [Nocardioides sp. 503]|uniref:MFS transporter n=1 Tax=Nocardioides sp. 503 TaxID=2508326 RepID=UPI001430F200|nr:MFS transporter [Nocardioides sp. 503]
MTRFVRGAPTVLSYAALLCFAFWVYGYGPALSLLRDELHFSYTTLGVYTAAWSSGTVVTGLLFAPLARRVPRATLLWGSSLLAVAGLALFVLGSGVAATLAGGAVLGVGGTMLLTAIQALLSDTHGEQRDRALVEANIGAAACAVAAPLALGALAAGALGWRAAFALPAVALLALFVRYRRLPLPDPAPRDTDRPGPLPPACWLYAGLAAASMAVEFCLAYFGTEELKDTGLTTGAAVLAMSSHYVGLLVGRVAGSVATRRPGRTALLLWASLAATAVGFTLFWLAPTVWVAVVGLFVAGLGIANLYPLAVALSLTAAPGREDQANSRSQLLGGLLVVTAPYLLGTLADRVGLTWAFTVEPALIALCVLLLVAGSRAERAAARQTEGA